MKRLIVFTILLSLPIVSISAELIEKSLIVQTIPRLMLYYSPTCPHSQKVLTYLESIHKTVPMKNVYASPQIKEELISIGGKAQVPCLIINNQPLYEADLIIQWLSENKDKY